MKLLCYLGERYYATNTHYGNANTSSLFIQRSFSDQEVLFTGGVLILEESAEIPFSSFVNLEHFFVVPSYQTTKEFLIKFLLNRSFRRQFLLKFDRLIASHPDSVFWARTPNPGAILFACRVLKAKRPLINHICADVAGAWRDPKYQGLERILGLCVAKVSTWLLAKICRNPLTLNLCTGDKLEAFARRYAPLRTHQMVDIVSPLNTVSKQESDRKREPSGDFNVLFVGRVIRAKGVFDLVGALNRLPSGVRLTIAGAGADGELLKQYVQTLRLDDRVTLVGHVTGDTLYDLYADADILAVPSKNHFEGFPRVIMEGWWHGLPVLVANVGGVGAFVKNENNGLLLDVIDEEAIANAIAKLLDDSQLYEQLRLGAVSMRRISSGEYWTSQTRTLVDAHCWQLKVNNVI